jgi:hypothetical protein
LPITLEMRGAGISLIACVVALAGCGGSGGDGDELVALGFDADLDFRMDASDGPEHVFSIQSETTIKRDGHVRYEIDGEVTEYDAGPREVALLDAALAEVDWEQMEQEFPAESGESTMVVTYEGKERAIGDGYFAADGDELESSEAATRFGEALGLILFLAQEPGQRDAEAERNVQALAECTEGGESLPSCSERLDP